MVFSDTDLKTILECDPLANGKKDCIDISTSYPLSIGFHALGGYRNLNPGGFNAMDFVQDRVLKSFDKVDGPRTPAWGNRSKLMSLDPGPFPANSCVP